VGAVGVRFRVKNKKEPAFRWFIKQACPYGLAVLRGSELPTLECGANKVAAATACGALHCSRVGNAGGRRTKGDLEQEAS
jgi:hypothetical protein